jgi:hypothetical protein
MVINASSPRHSPPTIVGRGGEAVGKIEQATTFFMSCSWFWGTEHSRGPRKGDYEFIVD